MQINVQGADIYAYTGGKAFDAAKPTAIFIHGVLCDHSVWALQSRYMANHGWNVLAIDLPGHCKSSGQAPQTVEEAATFIGGAGIHAEQHIPEQFGRGCRLQDHGVLTGLNGFGITRLNGLVDGDVGRLYSIQFVHIIEVADYPSGTGAVVGAHGHGEGDTS